MGCVNQYLLPKIEVFYKLEWNKGGIHEKLLTIFKYKLNVKNKAEKVDDKIGSYV